MRHNWENCPGSICEGDDTPHWKENVIWYPGEPVCGRTPLTHAQRVQRKINKFMTAGKFEWPKRFFTWKTLDAVRRVTPQTKGGNPEADTTAPDRVVSQKTQYNTAKSRGKWPKTALYTSQA